MIESVIYFHIPKYWNKFIYTYSFQQANIDSWRFTGNSEKFFEEFEDAKNKTSVDEECLGKTFSEEELRYEPDLLLLKHFQKKKVRLIGAKWKAQPQIRIVG